MHPPDDADRERRSDSAARAPCDQGARRARSPGSGRVVCAIPARLASSRLPGKVLLELDGKPMIRHVFERASAARGIDEVVVLTDDARVRDVVEGFGGRCQLTPRDCPSGTDRIASAARDWPADAVINVQGDEPLLDPHDVELLAASLAADPEVEMVTLAAPATKEDLEDPDTVKVVRGLDGTALYFSRAPIPWPRRSVSATDEAPGLRHIGIYGYRRDVLLRLAALEPSPLERRESLEQLRALENGIGIRVLVTEHAGIGVDNPRDLERAERALRRQRSGEQDEETEAHGRAPTGPMSDRMERRVGAS